MDELTEVADAVADPVRREILVMLRHTPLTAGEIAARFTISRPAVSRHLRVLRESGLVRDEQVGRHRRYSLVRSRLGGLAAWLGQFDDRHPVWATRLAALDTEVHRTRRDRGRVAPADTAHHSKEDTA
ncbi:metalloregulator ArsR/SmtB family transcription factor [Streptomyces ureilyticus]|uniref:Winged helix-turn-helix transcriptional regulator n=1 Tax=Streptomyces ureilyticus TaxID=1775131 RepID=A0ABX0DTQ6_9ACTN|nr:metalloregulator ArsR/SmtB family transcription factor [Streptomyces ureilyticus]NGO43264.1 winged helix-turn-helix transcriptional regulator [Streptomyces ureilyticus]